VRKKARERRVKEEEEDTQDATKPLRASLLSSCKLNKRAKDPFS
jgi:hypothetical protein